MEPCKKLIHQRGQIKGRVTSIVHQLESAVQNPSLVSSALLQTFEKKLDLHYSEYASKHDSIISLDPPDIEEQDAKSQEFDELHTRAFELLNQLKTSRQPSPPVTSVASPSQQVVVQQPLKVPIPSFDGKYENWPKFKALFTDVVGRCGDSDATKIHYLDKALVGEAAGILDAKVISDNNYQRAWKLLLDRYDNPRVIVDTHVNGLLGMRPMSKEGYKELRQLLDTCTRHVEGLKFLNQPIDGTCGLFITKLLTRCLDAETRKQWERSLKHAELPKYEDTLKFLTEYCQVLERCEKDSPAQIKVKTFNSNQPTRTTVSKTSNPVTSSSETVCDFCQEPHLNFKCSSFMNLSVEDRHARVKDLNLCFNCLRGGHRSSHCPSEKSCSKCSRRHHTLVHFEQQRSVTTNPALSSENPESHENRSISTNTDAEVNVSCSSAYRPSTKHVFLMTAVVNVFSRNGNSQSLRVLLDSGSQVNFMTESAVKRLGLPKYPSSVPVIGVGGFRSHMKHKVVVRISSNYGDYVNDVECLVSPLVTGRIPTVEIDPKSWNIPPGVTLADPNFFRPGEVEMLLGAELFFQILKQPRIHLADHLPSLCETQFGWVVCGAYSNEELNFSAVVCAGATIVDSLEACMQKFFDQEEVYHDSVLTEDEQAKMEDCCMDDVLTGALTVEKAKELRQDIEKVMSKGGFPVTKWCSNSEEADVPEEDREELMDVGGCGPNEVMGALGILWDPKSDDFLFDCKQNCSDGEGKVFKRFVFSQMAGLFDPIGLISPVVVLAKVIMQELWQSKMGWDDPLNGDLLRRWSSFEDSSEGLSGVHVPKCVIPLDAGCLEMYGFADASDKAYGACLYIRAVFPDGTAQTRLLCSKSEMAPLKGLTIPRLELCASLLLARLVDKVVPLMELDFRSKKLWLDIQIVLAWLGEDPNRLLVFVRNRVAEINQLSKNYCWGYVRTNMNPAVVVSKGLSPAVLSRCELWWKGPKFLSDESFEEDALVDLPEEQIPEMKRSVVANVAADDDKDPEPVLTRYSSFAKLQRVMAHVLRFIRLIRTPSQQRKLTQALTIDDMRNSLTVIVRMVQREALHKENLCLQRGEAPKRFGSVMPSMDAQGSMRVGGRLQDSSLPSDARHQLVLPTAHHITAILIGVCHEEGLHEGSSNLLAAVHQRYWFANAGSAVRRVARGCVRCFRTRPKSVQPLMGGLPEDRVKIAAPFEVTGVDFAEPVFVKEGKRRPKVVKSCICLFVCLASGAIRLELVSDFATEAFLAALNRFVNERGLVRGLVSDNATCFTGVLGELRSLAQSFRDGFAGSKISGFLLRSDIEWEFVPPRSPNFWGLWKAGVKVIKTHITRTLGKTTLTFEERLEAVKRSNLLHVPSNRLSRWQCINQLRDHFWGRWSREYCSTLQARMKWTLVKPHITINTIVLLINDNQPPQTWRMGGVIAVFPGRDSTVRVADVKTSVGIFRRAISKLASLPISDNLPELDVSPLRWNAIPSRGENVRASERNCHGSGLLHDSVNRDATPSMNASSHQHH